MIKDLKLKCIFIGVGSSILFFITFGIVTVLIPNQFFARMSSITLLDYVFLIITSSLLGTYVGLHFFQKNNNFNSCSVAATGGGILGFLSFGCAVCNKVLILLLGFIGVITYIEPYQPLIGLVGIILLGYAVYKKGTTITNLP